MARQCEPGRRDCATGLMFDEEVERRRAEIRHIIANTPLASVPLKSGPKKARRPGTVRSKRVMGYAKRQSSY